MKPSAAGARTHSGLSLFLWWKYKSTCPHFFLHKVTVEPQTNRKKPFILHTITSLILSVLRYLNYVKVWVLWIHSHFQSIPSNKSQGDPGNVYVGFVWFMHCYNVKCMVEIKFYKQYRMCWRANIQLCYSWGVWRSFKSVVSESALRYTWCVGQTITTLIYWA